MAEGAAASGASASNRPICYRRFAMVMYDDDVRRRLPGGVDGAVDGDSALVPARNATRIATIHPLILSIERASSVGSNQSSELEPN